MSFEYNQDNDLKLNTEDIRKMLIKDGGLCPSCSKRIDSRSLLASYTNNEGVYYYLICMKCFNMFDHLDSKLKADRKDKIEKNLDNNIHIYAATLIRDQVDFNRDENKEISVLNNFRSPWNQDDEEYFNNNPGVKFRARKIFFGELEETFVSKPHLKSDAYVKNIKYAIIHHLADGQNLKSFVNDISNFPIDDEHFVAALFMILINEINPEKVFDIYEDIKQRKQMFDGIESFKTFY